MTYEWDTAKAAENVRKHGIDFSDAIAAIEDPNRLELLDSKEDYGEDGTQVIGASSGKILFVVVTLRQEDVCRLIFARKAT